MEIKSLKNAFLFYNGDEYMIYHDVYGLCAYSKSIKRIEENGKEKVYIEFVIADLCSVSQSTITRKIKQLENKFIYKDVKITYEKENHNGYNNIQEKYVKITLENR